MTTDERKEQRKRRRLLTAIDVPDCACPRAPVPCGCREYCRPGVTVYGPVGICDCPVRLPPACPHILSREHDLSNREWAELGEAAYPGEYAEPVQPFAPHRVRSREARVAVMARRRARGVSLWHPDDLREENTDHLGTGVANAGNGRPVERGLEVMGRRQRA